MNEMLRLGTGGLPSIQHVPMNERDGKRCNSVSLLVTPYFYSDIKQMKS